MPQPTLASRFAIVVFASLVSASVGCTSLPPSGSRSAGLLDNNSPAAANSPAPGAPPLIVEYRPQEGTPQRVQVPYQENMTVQSVLKAARADRRFSRLEVELHRAAPYNMGVERLGVRYNNGKNRVESGYDYAVYPGDHVVVKEDPSTLLDDMLGGAKDTIAVFSQR